VLLFFLSLVFVVAAPAAAVAVSSTDIFGGGGGGAGLRGVFALIAWSGIGLSCCCADLETGDSCCGSGCILRSSVFFMTDPVTFRTESGTFSGCTLTTDMGRFSWSCEGGMSSSLCGVLRNLLMGAPRNGTRFIRRLGAGVTVSWTGVFEPGELREIFSFGFLFSGELTSFCARRAVVNALSFMGWGISSSELSPISMFCIMGAFAEKPCDCPSTDSGESLRGRIEECARMRP
jgi:hypothetical protein